jgi:hypothetical protein
MIVATRIAIECNPEVMPGHKSVIGQIKSR